MSTTPNLALPYLEAAQAQKHVTHNEALRRLDAVVQIAVIDRDLTAPPAEPSEGDRYIVASGATGAWSGHDLEVTAWLDGAWEFFTPQEGWLAWPRDEDNLLIFDGAAWVDFLAHVDLAGGDIARLGVNASADATNRLSVNSPSVLFNRETDTINLTLNKAAAGDDARLTFQTGFSTRALFGLLGNDDFAFKVTPDGMAFFTAMVIDKDTGAVAFSGHSKFTAYLNFGQNYTAGAWRDLLFNNTRHNDQGDVGIASNVITFTAPHDGYYQFGLGATYETTGGSAPDKMQVGLSINGANPTGDRIGTVGAATLVSEETQAQVTALVKLSQGDTVNPKVFFTTNDGRVLADENFFWGAQVA